MFHYFPLSASAFSYVQLPPLPPRNADKEATLSRFSSFRPLLHQALIFEMRALRYSYDICCKLHQITSLNVVLSYVYQASLEGNEVCCWNVSDFEMIYELDFLAGIFYWLLILL